MSHEFTLYGVTRIDEDSKRFWFILQVWHKTGWTQIFDCHCLTTKKIWAERIANFPAYKKQGAKVVEFQLLDTNDLIQTIQTGD